MSDTQIKVDTGLLREYASRLKKANSRLKALEGDLEALYRREGLVDIGAILRSGDIGWSKTIDSAATYLLETAEDFENVENEICDLLARSMQGEHPFAFFDDGQQPWTIAGGLSQLEGNEEILSPMKNSRLITADELAALSPEEFVALLAAYSEPRKSSDKSLEDDANSPGILSHQELVDELTSRKIVSDLPPYENTTNWREEGQLYGFLTAGAGIVNQFIDAWNKGKRSNDPFMLSPIEVRKPAEPMLQNHKLELQTGQMAGKTLFEGVMTYATLGLGEAYAALRSAKSTRAITSAVDDGAANIAETARFADDLGLVDDSGARSLGKSVDGSGLDLSIEARNSSTSIDYYVGPNGKALPSQFKNWVGTNMQKELLSQAESPQLQNAIKQLYREKSFIGDGGTADVIRFEKQTGISLGKNGGSHIQKGLDMANYLENKVLKQTLSASDRTLAEKLLKDLISALGR